MGKTRRRVSPRLAKIDVSERRCYVKQAKKVKCSHKSLKEHYDGNKGTQLIVLVW